MKFWEFGITRITLPSKVLVIWIAHACLSLKSVFYLVLLIQSLLTNIVHRFLSSAKVGTRGLTPLLELIKLEF
jgi:hypothetical protein